MVDSASRNHAILPIYATLPISHANLFILLGKEVGGKERMETWRNLGCLQFGSVQSLSCVLLFGISWTAACQASLSITNSQSLLTHVH